MVQQDITKVVHNLNLSYLLLAQRLYESDPATAEFRLGMQEETMDYVSKLTLPQLIKLSESSQMLFQFRLDDLELLQRVTGDSRVADLQQIHTGILLSTQLLNSMDQ